MVKKVSINFIFDRAETHGASFVINADLVQATCTPVYAIFLVELILYSLLRIIHESRTYLHAALDMYSRSDEKSIFLDKTLLSAQPSSNSPKATRSNVTTIQEHSRQVCA